MGKTDNGTRGGMLWVIASSVSCKHLCGRKTYNNRGILNTGGIPLQTIGSTSKNVYGVWPSRKPHSAFAPLSRFLGGASKKSKWEIGGKKPDDPKEFSVE